MKDKVDISRFELSPAQVTEAHIEYFANVYGVDITSCTTSEMATLINFKDYGASAAIMDLLIRLSKRGQEG